MKTEKFLEYFPGHQVFAAFPDDESTSPPRHYHEEYEESTPALRKANNASHWGVFFTVNLLDRSLDPTNEATGRPRPVPQVLDRDVPAVEAAIKFPAVSQPCN